MNSMPPGRMGLFSRSTRDATQQMLRPTHVLALAAEAGGTLKKQ